MSAGALSCWRCHGTGRWFSVLGVDAYVTWHLCEECVEPEPGDE